MRWGSESVQPCRGLRANQCRGCDPAQIPALSTPIREPTHHTAEHSNKAAWGENGKHPDGKCNLGSLPPESPSPAGILSSHAGGAWACQVPAAPTMGTNQGFLRPTCPLEFQVPGTPGGAGLRWPLQQSCHHLGGTCRVALWRLQEPRLRTQP